MMSFPGSEPKGRAVQSLLTGLKIGRRVAGLRTRVLLLAAVVALPLVGLFAHMANREAAEEFEQAQQKAEQLVELADREFADWINTAQTAAEIVATATRNPTLDIAACDRFVEAVRSQYAWVNSMFVADVNGHKLCAAAGDDKSQNLLELEWFRETVETRQHALSNFLIGYVSGRPQINVGVPQLDRRGEIARVVGVGIDLAAFNQHLATLRRDEDATFTILDENGTILARQPDPDGFVGRQTHPDPAAAPGSCRFRPGW